MPSSCQKYLSYFKKVDDLYIEAISPKVCHSITLSTLHGCPSDEIERIAVYLLSEKGLHSFIKCNPTMLGYEYARQTMDELGFDYMVLTITILKKIYNLKKQYRCYNVCNY